MTIQRYQCLQVPEKPSVAWKAVMDAAGLEESDAKAFVGGRLREITTEAAWALKLSGFQLSPEPVRPKSVKRKKRLTGRMKAEWAVVGKGRYRTWTLLSAQGEPYAKIYAGTQLCSYLVHDDGQELLFNNTSPTLDAHKHAVREALFSRYERLQALFGRA